tara:strand:+ start:1386 stop:1625 length:240 start_codon:yes stop_codon:yes gene_type:complete
MSNKKIVKSGNKGFAQRFKHPDIVLIPSEENPPPRVLQDFSRLGSPHHNFAKNGGCDDEIIDPEITEALYYINKVQNKG